MTGGFNLQRFDRLEGQQGTSYRFLLQDGQASIDTIQVFENQGIHVLTERSSNRGFPPGLNLHQRSNRAQDARHRIGSRQNGSAAIATVMLAISFVMFLVINLIQAWSRGRFGYV